MKKILIISSMLIVGAIVFESCKKPACGTKSQKKKKMKALKKGGTFNM